MFNTRTSLCPGCSPSLRISVSGYKINLQKSEVFPISSLARTYPFHTLPFKVTHDQFTYLGVQITNSIGRLFKENLNPLLTKVEQILKRWMLLHLSLAGRINAIKMTLLPKFFFSVSQCISPCHSLNA